ncbi:MAG: pirin [Alphaproteobacteria bacterium]|nr:pirin [Alphaproteobacteria bacterium]
MNNKNLDKLITEVLEVEAEAAKEAGSLGYMARALVQATLPHSKVKGHEFKRTNGLFKLTILADSEIGIPYGSMPRLLLSWISTEAVRTKDRNLILGRTLSSFMSDLDLIPSGGRWGTITCLKEQMKRLFASSISCTYDNGKNWAIKNITPISKADLWWNPKQPNQATIFDSTLTLSEDFFKEIIDSPIPIDMRVLKDLKRSPLAIDIYCWLTYRLSYLKNVTTIPWEALQIQFGANYAADNQGKRDFKKAFLRELKKVNLFYRQAKLESLEKGLKLIPSSPHIKSVSNSTNKKVIHE